ncbi:MAG TPA: hypothetical protein VL860_10990 [Planctomycetota bacterium]|nr:hypothetical protein [Planctomycetota bacterium]
MSPSRTSTNEATARARLTADLRNGLDAGRFASDAAFESMYRRVAAYQHRFGLGMRLAHATDALPVELFKYRRIATTNRLTSSGGYFLSSGTSRGVERRARHEFADFGLYEAALSRGFAQAVLSHDHLDSAWTSIAPRWNFLVPTGPRWWNDPHSSLAHMGRTLWHSLATNAYATLHCIDPAAPAGEFRRQLRRLGSANDRVTLGFGTGFGFLHLSDRLAHTKLPLSLHPDSRVMETGGYKGHGRELVPAALHAELATRFKLKPAQVFAEYGMTELSSQAYQIPTGTPAPYPHLPVYWPAETLRIRVVDANGRPCAAGEVGLIEATDLMNLTSACRVLLGDLGVIVPARRGRHQPQGEFARRPFQVLGRAQRLAARGCGLADDLRLLTALNPTAQA